MSQDHGDFFVQSKVPTSNFRSIEVCRYLDLRVACSTSVLFEVSMSNLPPHASRMLSTTLLPLLKKSDCMVLGTQTSAMADVQWNRWSQLVPSRMAACLVEPMAPLGGYCLLNKRGSSMHGFATVQIKPIYY